MVCQVWTLYSGNCFFDSLCSSSFVPCNDEYTCQSLLGLKLCENPVLLHLAEIASSVWNDDIGFDHITETEVAAEQVSKNQKEKQNCYLENSLKDSALVGVQMEILACIAVNIMIVIILLLVGTLTW